jgi:hypothetical protein
MQFRGTGKSNWQSVSSDMQAIYHILIQSVPWATVNILGGHSICHSKKQKVYIYVCPIPNCFQDRVISLYSSKIVAKKEILRIVSNIGIYCSSDKVGTGTVYLVYILVNVNKLCNSCEDMACCSPECIATFLYAGNNIHSSISEIVRNRARARAHARTRTHTFFV